MKYITKLLLLSVAIGFAFSSCHKVEDLPYYENGQKVTLAASQNAVSPTVADSLNDVVIFSWTNPNYATDTSSVKFIVEIDSAGRNFAKSTTKQVVGKLSTTLTGRELNTIALNYGFTLGTPYNMDVRVISSYGNNNERYTSNTIGLSVTPYADPSSLTSTSNSVVTNLATANQNSLTFSWSRAFPGYAGTIDYVLQYDSATKNFATPFEFPVGTNLLTQAMTEGQINTTGLNSGIPGGNTGTVEYRIKATTAQGAVSYSNVFLVSIKTYFPLLRFYLPGGYQAATGNGNDWDPTTAPELVRDLRPGVLNNMYYIYIYLPANAEFKVTQGRSWDVNYGGTAGTMAPGGANFTVPTAGYYRVSIDRNAMKYDIREGRMGFVGGATGADWTPPNVFPNYALGAAATNLFVGITTFNNGGWKLIDNNEWNNGTNTVTETRSYGTTAPSGSTMQVNGDNFADITTPGRYRVIWDGRDVNNIKYEMSPATEMRLVGDGMNVVGVNDWDPPTSPQMVYGGNGVWTITIALKAGKDIKFLAGNAWGAFDYEDNSGQNAALGTNRKIKWEGGDNFKTPAVAGTYTITLNENLQTMKIE